ncbi:contact-dependent growth inhibition system immunity protein [Asanoa sp. NPDC050611]|uniref:contact-dependent growth inhibition system immunity protein n=1 Tax=Asanoa sp. NPDC050611 TaxID=3157098 RepID=UPI00340AE930
MRRPAAKAVGEFASEEAVPVLPPIVMTVLADDPLVEGDFYPGDLLVAVGRLPASAWRGAALDRARLSETLRGRHALHTDVRDAVAAFLHSGA